MSEDAIIVSDGLRELRAQVDALKRKRTKIEIWQRAANTLSTLPSTLLQGRPNLIVTSPPYPSVHVLYHRWQVQGRKETPAPFWIADCQDGQGSSFYTFGDRRHQQHEKLYFSKLLSAFTEIRKVVRDDAYVVQLVGFGKPEEQLPVYLETMREAGFEEQELNGHRTNQFWRAVPNRKWYTWLREETKQTSEVLLVHRPSGTAP
jgi:hypothetical protein